MAHCYTQQHTPCNCYRGSAPAGRRTRALRHLQEYAECQGRVWVQAIRPPGSGYRIVNTATAILA
eukprot:901885-Amphidinium_carterae.1